MARKSHYRTRFQAGHYYHIYNRCIDKKPLFKREENFRFFLSRMQKYLSSVLEIHAYCLLTNHFHLLVKVRTESELGPAFGEKDIHLVVAHQLQRFFQSYAMAFNRQENRVGSLFQQPFKRALVTSQAYLTWLVFYIHSNAQKHAMVSDFRQWKWSSFMGFAGARLRRHQKEVVSFFGSKEAFFSFHAQQLDSLDFFSPTRMDWLPDERAQL